MAPRDTPCCPRCGHPRPARARQWRPLLMVLPLWVIPVAFAVHGSYPVGILVVALLTLWAAQQIRRCPGCGGRLPRVP